MKIYNPTDDKQDKNDSSIGVLNTYVLQSFQASLLIDI